MATPGWQTWNSAPFRIERYKGKAPGTVILRFSGPFTVRDVYTCLPPLELNKILDLPPVPGEDPTIKNILDMTNCPYIDSSGVGMVVTHHVRCQRKGIKLIAAGLSPRVLQVFKMTKVDTLFPNVATVEDAENA
jgi:hypothetical protein